MRGRALRGLLVTLLVPVVLLTGLWGTLALWFRLPGGTWVQGAGAGLFAVFALLVLAGLFVRDRRLQAVMAYAVAFAALLAWWSTIQPQRDRDWAPDVARQTTGTVDGNRLTLVNLRNFDWRSETDVTERWETREYDLSRLKSLDMFLSYWAGPEMAHVILSFGFEDGQFLAWSIEVRRQRGGAFSPVADLFKTNELVILAADERDVVRVRSNVRGEDVQLYRLRARPPAARELLLEYVADANALAKQPRFYNSITTNCTTAILKMMRALGAKIPFDWRLFVNGFLPDFAYDKGALDTRYPLEELRALSHIAQRALAAGDSPEFSQLIRVGVPAPWAPRTSGN
jgi:hypothetical protein